jgi:hypothetical protein
MMDLIMAMIEQATAEAAKAGVADAAGSAMASAMETSPSIGQQVGDYATQGISKQMQPEMDAYKVMVNPQSTPGDMGRAAFQYATSTSATPETPLPQAPQGFNPYSYMSNNSIQGIPSILQNSNSGLLPFITGR